MIRFLISMTAELKHDLSDLATKKGLTLNGLIRLILIDWVEKKREDTDEK